MILFAADGRGLTKAGTVGVEGVPAMVGSFKVLDAVVCLVAVDVVDLRSAIWRRAKEGHRDEPVNPEKGYPPITAQQDLKVTVTRDEFPIAARNALRGAGHPADIAAIGDLVEPFVSADASPVFAHAYHLKAKQLHRPALVEEMRR